MSSSRVIRSRFAPSPTMSDGSSPHLGYFRTLYHSSLAAAAGAEGSKFLVRIDDTDLERSTEPNINAIYKSIDDIGLSYDYTFKQSDRFDLYREKAEALVKLGCAFKETTDKGTCIRLNSDVVSEISNDIDGGTLCDWKDQITGDKFSNENIDKFAFNQVIIKSDGSPTYNFCTVIDDIEEDMTDIIRGTDHISNTYKQMVFYRLFSALPPNFWHVGLVCNQKGAKLSKRESNDLNLDSYSSAAKLNYVLRLGWSPTVDDKSNNIIDTAKAISMFWNGGKLKASNSKIDINKLVYYDRKYRVK